MSASSIFTNNIVAFCYHKQGYLNVLSYIKEYGFDAFHIFFTFQHGYLKQVKSRNFQLIVTFYSHNSVKA